MRAAANWLICALGAAVVVLTIGQSTPESIALVVAVAVAAALVVRAAVRVDVARDITIGARAHAHRELLKAQPAPSHPTTAGRPLGRAPTQSIAAA